MWYNEGSDPAGPILHSKLKDMINRGINASAGMLILNPNARSTYKIGMRNSSFSRGSVHYVGNEIRAVILSKMHLAQGDTVCVISGESIAVESAILACEGTVIAVEYSQGDRTTMEENVRQFGLNNISIIDHVDDETLAALPAPHWPSWWLPPAWNRNSPACCRNPHMEFLIYTLDFRCAATLPALFERLGIRGDRGGAALGVQAHGQRHLPD